MFFGSGDTGSAVTHRIALCLCESLSVLGGSFLSRWGVVMNISILLMDISCMKTYGTLREKTLTCSEPEVGVVAGHFYGLKTPRNCEVIMLIYDSSPSFVFLTLKEGRSYTAPVASWGSV